MTSTSYYYSKIDDSVNFVLNKGRPGRFLEARYVRRTPEVISAYLSSTDGCNLGCGFCHLTTSGQTSMGGAFSEDFQKQADEILEYYRKTIEAGEPTAKQVYFNFMARGELLSNTYARKWWKDLASRLANKAEMHNLLPRFNVSTIMPVMPEGYDYDLREVFAVHHPVIYYSFYSTYEEFRKKWLPRALPWREALRRLKEWQDYSKRLIKIHYAIIQGENDGGEEPDFMADECAALRLAGEVNLVRFNPPEGSTYREASDGAYDSHEETWKSYGYPCKIKPRVGFDVKASCGQFYS